MSANKRLIQTTVYYENNIFWVSTADSDKLVDGVLQRFATTSAWLCDGKGDKQSVVAQREAEGETLINIKLLLRCFIAVEFVL